MAQRCIVGKQASGDYAMVEITSTGKNRSFIHEESNFNISEGQKHSYIAKVFLDSKIYSPNSSTVSRMCDKVNL